MMMKSADASELYEVGSKEKRLPILEAFWKTNL